jgi:hypothetical protein
VKGIEKGKRDQRSLSYVANQRGAEAGNAGAAGMANAGIDNSGRAVIEQAAAEFWEPRLRDCAAGSREQECPRHTGALVAEAL